MLKKSFFLFFIIGCFGIGFAIPSSLQAHVDLQCPGSVTAGAPFDATVNISNDSASSITIGRALASLGGNSANTLSGIGLFGPFSRALSATIQAGGSISRTVRIINAVPSDLKGKVAVAMVTLTSADFKTTFGTGSCFIVVK